MIINLTRTILSLYILFEVILAVNLRGNSSIHEKDGERNSTQLDDNEELRIDHLFTIPNFLNPEIYQKYLPRVCILGVSRRFYQTAIDYHQESLSGSPHSMVITEHSHDLLFYHWLLTYYEKTIEMKYLPKRKKYVYLPTHTNYQQAMNLTKRTQSQEGFLPNLKRENVIDTFFVPTGMPSILLDYTHFYWKGLSHEMDELVSLNHRPKSLRRTPRKKSATKGQNRPHKNANAHIPLESTPESAKETSEISKSDESAEKPQIQRKLQDKEELQQFIETIARKAPVSPSDKRITAIPASKIPFNVSSSPASSASRYKDPINETDLLQRSLPNYTFPFTLENTFVAASYLDQTRPIQYLFHFTRNIRDVHFLRVDNELTPNGRDLFIPYYISRIRYQALTNINITLSLTKALREQRFNDNMTTNSLNATTPSLPSTINPHQLYKRKKYFFMAACREPPGKGENSRLYRTSLYESLKEYNAKDSIVSRRMTSYQFDYVMFNSDFCFIIPGDTSSTSKLYKAIFSHCIPVIFISYPSQLPFYHFIKWESFAIIVYKDIIKNSQKLRQLLDFLSLLRNHNDYMNKLNELKRNLFSVSILFDYDKYDYPSVYHLLLMELQYTIQHEQQYAHFY
eukprot:gene14917-16604_t